MTRSACRPRQQDPEGRHRKDADRRAALGGDVHVLVAGKGGAVADAAAKLTGVPRCCSPTRALYDHMLAGAWKPSSSRWRPTTTRSSRRRPPRQELHAAHRRHARRGADLRHRRGGRARHVRAADLRRQRAADGANPPTPRRSSPCAPDFQGGRGRGRLGPGRDHRGRGAIRRSRVRRARSWRSRTVRS